MTTLQTGEFYGAQDKKLELENVVLTYTTYTHPKVDWHRHENAYFTFLLMGKMAEISHTGRQDCTPGSLLFHNSDEPHYNLKPRDHTRGFHIELRKKWFAQNELQPGEGSYAVHDPRQKLMVVELFREFLSPDLNQEVAIDSLINSLMQPGQPTQGIPRRMAPKWVMTIRDLINDLPTHDWTLTELGNSANIHPNHLCRAFSSYFGCTLGHYLKAVRIQRAVTLMISSDQKLSEIAHACGFADQSHFIRTFRKFHRLTPLAYRKGLSKQG